MGLWCGGLADALISETKSLKGLSLELIGGLSQLVPPLEDLRHNGRVHHRRRYGISVRFTKWHRRTRPYTCCTTLNYLTLPYSCGTPLNYRALPYRTYTTSFYTNWYTAAGERLRCMYRSKNA